MLDRSLLPARHSEGWYSALDEFIAGRQQIAFAWGSNDCCSFAADWVEIARGTDPMADLRGVATGARRAARVLAASGGLLAAVTARMGPPDLGLMAQVGDVVLVRHGEAMDRLSMGVCLGETVAVPSPKGMALAPITSAEAAWRV